jgi:hypothetical protein
VLTGSGVFKTMQWKQEKKNPEIFSLLNISMRLLLNLVNSFGQTLLCNVKNMKLWICGDEEWNLKFNLKFHIHITRLP